MRTKSALVLLFFLIFNFYFFIAPAEAEAARMVIGLVAGAIGAYFFGPVGFAIGYSLGSIAGGMLFPEKLPTVRGPRLEDKMVQSAAFGTKITKHWGTDRLAAQIIFASGLKETEHKKKVGGKGMGGSSQSQVTYTYAVDIMLAFSRRAKGVLRIWADTKLIYDVRGDPNLAKLWNKEGKNFTVRDGNESQLPSALEESYHGVGQVSAHRGLFCLEAADFQLANFANRIPNFTAEVFTEGESDFVLVDDYQPPAPPYSWWVASWGYMDPTGEVWALYVPFSTRYWYPGYSRVFHWALNRPDDPVEEFHPFWSATNFVQSASVAGQVRLRSDEPSAMVYGTGGPITYFLLEAGTQINFDTSPTAGAGFPEVAVHFGGEFHVVSGNGLYLGPNPHLLTHYSGAGGYIGDTMVLDSVGGGTTVRDLGRSDNFLWALFQNQVVKLDPSSLTVISQIDISNIENVLAMAVVSDTEARLVSATAEGTKFWVLLNDGPPVLDQHAVDTTYQGIRGFHRFGLRFVNGTYVVDFAGYVGGFQARIDFFGPKAEGEGLPLWKIVRDINIMAGLDSVIDSVPPTVGEIKVGELVDIVHGYSLTRGMTARDALLQLAVTYFFDCRETDLKLDYPKRGKPPVLSLPGADLSARSSITEALPDRLSIVRARESELPLRVHVIYNNLEASYQPGHEYAPRLITDARSTKSVQIAVAITSTKARQVADVLLAMAWLERESFQLRTSRRYLPLDAADNIEVVITEE